MYNELIHPSANGCCCSFSTPVLPPSLDTARTFMCSCSSTLPCGHVEGSVCCRVHSASPPAPPPPQPQLQFMHTCMHAAMTGHLSQAAVSLVCMMTHTAYPVLLHPPSQACGPTRPRPSVRVYVCRVCFCSAGWSWVDAACYHHHRPFAPRAPKRVVDPWQHAGVIFCLSCLSLHAWLVCL